MGVGALGGQSECSCHSDWGIVGELYGWRMVFSVAGVPALILALLFRFSVRESE